MVRSDTSHALSVGVLLRAASGLLTVHQCVLEPPGFVKGSSVEHPDHCIVIKYLPAAGDDKKALDDYTSEIGMGGRNTLS